MTGESHKSRGRTGGRRRRGAAPIVRKGTARLPHEIARRIRSGHPWVYREAIDARRVLGELGAPVELVDWDGEFVGRGVVDGTSAIAVRVVSRRRDEKLDSALWRARTGAALALRARLLDESELGCCRLINAESDGLPGIVAERYGDYIVVQLMTPAALGVREAVYDQLEAELSPRAIYEQRRFRPLSGEAPQRQAAELVRGAPAPVELEVKEGALGFHVDVTSPLSTGFFIDLRLGRRAVARWARGRRVLNLFSYTGAISVYAAHGGAESVTAVDVAAKAHARARRNFTLNDLDAESCDHITGDVFKSLARMADRDRRFDMVVIDPPAFGSASRGGKPWSAVKDYRELVAAVCEVLEPGGVLVAASSTHKINHAEFDQILADGSTRADAALAIVERVGLPPDFPVRAGFPEGNYLKFVIAVRDSSGGY